MNLKDRTAYDAARTGAVYLDLGRKGLKIYGKDPAQMLLGITTGSIPRSPEPLGNGDEDSLMKSQWAYSSILTPKGRLVSDLRVLALPGEPRAFVLDLPAAGWIPVKEHLKRVLPPRFAKAEEWGRGMTSLWGPRSPRILAERFGLPETALAQLQPGEALHTAGGEVVLRAPAGGALRLDVWGADPRPASPPASYEEHELQGGTPAIWDILRVEAGVPEFGADIGPENLLPEAGIADQVVDHTKGCYTGQEVVVRIRDRGHVNRHLRGVMLSAAADPPEAGTELFSTDTGKSVGHLTTVVESPQAGRPLGLGYVRREVEPFGAVRVGLPEGPPAEVRELGTGWWRPE